MTGFKGLRSAIVLASVIAIPVLTNGCSSTSNPLSSLCCSDFKVGADLSAADFGVSGTAKGQFFAFAQSASDFAAAADSLTNEVTTACMNIAVDLGADPNDASVAGKSGGDLTTAWCTLAAAKISAEFTGSGSIAASGGVTINFQPPQCNVNIQAQASCQGHCDVSGKCDIKANPPTCKGGNLVVDCKGQCDVTAEEPSINCQGTCAAQCTGECQATAGATVDCDGKCDGTCAAGGSANGSGLQADGSCKGTCSGKCVLRADAKVSCSGSCSGKCTGSCKATGGSASVKCSGKCNADYQPLTCEGGSLQGGCQVDANCQANCNASASAKAECTPPALDIVAKGQVTAAAQTQFTATVNTLETNLPALVLALQAKGKSLVDLGGTFVGSIQATAPSFTGSAEAAVCAGIIVDTVVKAGANVTVSVSAATKVTDSAGIH